MLSVCNWFLGCCLMLLLRVPELAVAQTLDALQKLEVVDVPLVAWVTSREHALPNTLADFAEPEDVQTLFAASWMFCLHIIGQALGPPDLVPGCRNQRE
jgi:hypothetical protein